jgi:hypothetical protein
MTRNIKMSFKLNRLFHVVGVLLIATQVSFSQTGEKEAMRVLFVGNSFTYFFNLPQVVSSMAENQGVTIVTRQSTVGGSTLEEHWKELKGTRTRKLLDSLKWDYVVINNHSLITVDDPAKFMDYSKKFIDLIRSKGAKPIIMQTWGYKSNPLLIRPIMTEYAKLAQSTGADMVPAGELFMEARKWRPDLELFQDDKHPSSNGTYLLGLAFFKYFTGKSTADIPFRLTTQDKDGEKLYLLFMSQEDADFLQQLVDDFEMKTLAK